MWEIAGRVHIFESGFRGPSTGRVGLSGLSQCGISLSTVFRMNVGRPPRVFVVFRPPANVDYERAAFLRVLSFARARARVTLGRIQTILLETWQQFVALTKEMLREANISL